MKQKTALITGITGQDGSYLAEFLLSKKYKVIGLVSSQYNIGWQNINHLKSKLILEDGDLLDTKSLKRIILKHKPHEIYNLGGLTFIPKSWDNPFLVLDINTLGVARILKLLVDYLPRARLYQASSAKIFGLPKVFPQTETTPLSPQDPYSTSKAAAHMLVQNFRSQFDLFAVNGIMYNHESERRGEEFVTRKITLTAAKIKLGQAKQLTLGNLDAQQDWGYAPDYVNAMWMMLQQKSPQDFIIASNKLHSVRDICKIAFSHFSLNYKDFVTIDPRFFRKTTAKALTGNPAKAQKYLKWKPRTTFEQMIVKMADHDLSLLQKK